CHNIADKEPAWWKRWLTNGVLRRGDALVVHAATEGEEAWRRSKGRRVVRTFLPVHELGGAAPSRAEAKRTLGLDGRNVALFFGHIRPFKGLDIALRAWSEVQSDVTLLVAGEAWWKSEEEYRQMWQTLCSGRLQPADSRPAEAGPYTKAVFEFRYIPDSEIATYFAAADVILAPYRIEAQSGVALTAFHFGRPVIATRVGGLPEIIDGNNGMLIPPEDPAALARAVDEFFTRRDRAGMERAAEATAQRLSWPEYAKVFKTLVSGR